MSSKRPPTIFQHPLIETHCHLDYLKQDLQQTLADAKAVNIERIITIAVSPGNLKTVRELCQQDAMIYGTQGVHPHDAEQYQADCEAEIRECIDGDKILAVGEIGLDYFYNNAERGIQREVFEKQLQIAIDKHKPVVIHTREADADTIAILKNMSSDMACKGVIHSFTSTPELAEFCLSEGFYLGFNGISTFKKADNVRDIIALCPIEKTLLETDAPYLTPTPYRGKENAPYYLPFIAEQIAATKNIRVEQVVRQSYENTIELFFPQEQADK